MSGRVQDRVCIVTGAGSGIGEASAIRLAEEGGKIVCADINEPTRRIPRSHKRDDRPYFKR